MPSSQPYPAVSAFINAVRCSTGQVNKSYKYPTNSHFLTSEGLPFVLVDKLMSRLAIEPGFSGHMECTLTTKLLITPTEKKAELLTFN